MSVAENISFITGLVTSITAIVAILYVVKQTRQLDNTLRSQVYQGLIDNSLKIDELLIENPNFRKYIYGNEPIDKNVSDHDKIMSVMEFMIDIIDNIRVQENYIPKSEKLGWKKFTEDVLNSSAAKYFLKEHGTWYSLNSTSHSVKPKKTKIKNKK